MAAGQRNEAPLLHPWLLPARNKTGQIRTMSQIPFKAVFETWQGVNQLPLDRFHCQKRQQTNQRTHPQRKISSTRCAQDVVVKLVLFIPKADALAAQIIHGRGNAEEMFEKLGRNIFVNGIFAGQLNCDPH